jgi:hypothetical protein
MVFDSPVFLNTSPTCNRTVRSPTRKGYDSRSRGIENGEVHMEDELGRDLGQPGKLIVSRKGMVFD